MEIFESRDSSSLPDWMNAMTADTVAGSSCLSVSLHEHDGSCANSSFGGDDDDECDENLKTRHWAYIFAFWPHCTIFPFQQIPGSS